MKKLLAFTLIVTTSLVSCGPGNGQFTTKSVSMPTHVTLAQEKPTILQEGDYQIVHGATSTTDMKVVYNPDLKTFALRGKLLVSPLNENNPMTVDIDMAGLPDSQGFVYLYSKDSAPALPQGVELGAKATCLGEDLDCSSSFIDIYVIYKEKVYHHQLESQAPAKNANSSAIEQQQQESTQEQPPQTPAAPVTPKSAPVVAAPPVITPVAPPKVAPPAKSDKTKDIADDDEEETPESDDTATSPGRYVGDFKKDIDKIMAENKVAPKATTIPQTSAPAPKAAPTKPTTPPVTAPKTTPKQTPKTTTPVKTDTPKTSTPVTPATPTPAAPAAPDTSLVNQSIGPAGNGRLENASSLLAYAESHDPTGFHIISPARKTYFANRETIAMIASIGQFTLKEVPNNIVSIGDMSYEKGGPLGHHLSHTNGVDSDISFYFSDRSLQGRLQTALKGNGVDPAWMIPEQWALFKKLVDTKTIDRMFIHKTLKMAICELAIKNGELRKGDTTSQAAETLRRLVPNADHYNHFHMRLKCSKEQIRCRQMVDPAPGSGCF